jgi:transcriptional regulator with XRE-family HTH domain
MSTADPSNQRSEMAARLREAREYLGMSQDEVATALKLSRPAITNIESGARKVEAVELEQLSNLYGRPVNFFLTGKMPVEDPRVAFAARALRGLTPRDLQEVARFADYLRTASRNKAAKGKK